MTKPQIWIASFLLLFIALFILQKITQEPSVSTNNPGQTTMGQTTTNEDLSGKDLIAQWGCSSCHGADLNGTKLAPPLVSLNQYWSRDELLNYLRNPGAYMGSSRFQDYKKQYPGTIMPAYGNKNVKDLGKVAEYLLSR